MSMVPASQAGSGYMAAQAAARGLGPSTSTSVIAGDYRKIHTSFTETGSEMVEEYDIDTNALLLRKLRHKTSLGAWGPWEFEVGEPVAKFNADKDLILESSSNPLFVRQDTLSHFQFRIRNLPYDIDNYIVEIDDEKQEIVLKTKNKKYYKRMSIPDLKAGGDEGKLNKKLLSYKHANNTLIISYEKQPFIVALERANLAAISRMGNGDTVSSGQKALESGSSGSTPASATQAIVAEAKSNRAKDKKEGGEFAGLKGLQGLAKKDADCKQQ